MASRACALTWTCVTSPMAVAFGKAEAVAAAATLAVLAVVWRYYRCRRASGGYYRPLPPAAVEVITSMERAEEVASRWLRDVHTGTAAPVIGLDTEWVGKRPVALLQLADERYCALVRLCRMQGAPPAPSLLALLADPSVLKVGVGVQQDVALLQRALAGCTPRGAVDAATLAIAAGLRGGGLSALAWEVLGVHLDKSPALRCSDWEAEVLSAAQIDYAAKDASVSHALLRALHGRYAAHAAAPQPLAEWAAQYVGKPPQQSRKGKGGGAAQPAIGAAAPSLQQQPSGGAAAKGGKPSGRLKSRAGPLYDGWLMCSPAG
eukprot:2805441-Prymnesium_polylepis.2